MVNTGSTAWVLTSAALVMFRTPGLALFYGGMVRAESILNVMVLTFVCLAVVGLVWVLYRYSLAFGNDWFGGLLGDLRPAGLRDLGWPQQAVRPHNLPFVMFGAGLLWSGWFG